MNEKDYTIGDSYLIVKGQCLAPRCYINVLGLGQRFNMPYCYLLLSSSQEVEFFSLSILWNHPSADRFILFLCQVANYRNVI